METEDKKAAAQAKSTDKGASGKETAENAKSRSKGARAVIGSEKSEEGKQRAAENKKAAEERKEYKLINEATVDGEKVPAGETVMLTEDGRRYFQSKHYIK